MGEEKTLNTDKQLRRELTLIDLVSLALGGIIGSAWLFSALSAASIAGPSAVLSWVIGGILIIFIGLAYAELGTAVPRSGGIVRYPHYSHGSYAGYMLAVLYLISAVTTPSIEAEAVVEYLASISPLNFLTTSVNGVNVLTVYGILLAICLMVVFFLVNYFGIKALGKTNTGITIWKLVVPTVTFILLFFAFNSKNFTSYGFLPTGNSNGLIDVFYAIPASGIVYAYLGFRQPVEYAGEAKNPQRDIGRAIVISLAIAIIIYTLLQIAFIGALDWTSAGISTPGNWTALTSSSWASGPFYNELENSGKALGLALLVYWGYALLVDAVISPSGTGLVYIGTTTRTFYGIAADRYFPEFFLRLNKYKIPIFSPVSYTHL
ncbi:APC family permease, partial [Sulfolobus acidocaldarius]|uniref:APC family permease n=1 Tax=Sulfolobus acidocaldarius TaxID=2285 RepID=UPI0012D87BFC